MLPLVLVFTGWGFLIPAVAGFATGRLSRVHSTGLLVIANTLFGVGNAMSGESLWVCVNAAAAALSAWSWWNSGGGDGTKRRLKQWGRRFQGVRRTAPSHA
jgi:hypothetical protein